MSNSAKGYRFVILGIQPHSVTLKLRDAKGKWFCRNFYRDVFDSITYLHRYATGIIYFDHGDTKIEMISFGKPAPRKKSELGKVVKKLEKLFPKGFKPEPPKEASEKEIKRAIDWLTSDPIKPHMPLVSDPPMGRMPHRIILDSPNACNSRMEYRRAKHILETRVVNGSKEGLKIIRELKAPSEVELREDMIRRDLREVGLKLSDIGTSEKELRKLVLANHRIYMEKLLKKLFAPEECVLFEHHLGCAEDTAEKLGRTITDYGLDKKKVIALRKQSKEALIKKQLEWARTDADPLKQSYSANRCIWLIRNLCAKPRDFGTTWKELKVLAA